MSGAREILRAYKAGALEEDEAIDQLSALISNAVTGAIRAEIAGLRETIKRERLRFVGMPLESESDDDKFVREQISGITLMTSINSLIVEIKDRRRSRLLTEALRDLDCRAEQGGLLADGTLRAVARWQDDYAGQAMIALKTDDTPPAEHWKQMVEKGVICEQGCSLNYGSEHDPARHVFQRDDRVRLSYTFLKGLAPSSPWSAYRDQTATVTMCPWCDGAEYEVWWPDGLRGCFLPQDLYKAKEEKT